jgi:anti-anti-sigma factor
MAFNSTLQQNDGTAVITLTGELDASTAPQFKEEVERAASRQIQRLVLMMQGLDFMASAGLRVLIFAKQKMGPNVDIYVIGPQEHVLDTLRKTGFDRSCIVQETYA